MNAKRILVLAAALLGFSVLVASEGAWAEKECPIKRTVDCGGNYGTPAQPVSTHDMKLRGGVKEVVGFSGRNNIVHYPDEQGGCTISGKKIKKHHPEYMCFTMENLETKKRWRVVKDAGAMPVIIYEITRSGEYRVARDFRTSDTQIAGAGTDAQEALPATHGKSPKEKTLAEKAEDFAKEELKKGLGNIFRGR